MPADRELWSSKMQRFEQIGTVDVSIVKSVWAECAWYQWLEGWYGWACFVSIASSSIWTEHTWYQWVEVWYGPFRVFQKHNMCCFIQNWILTNNTYYFCVTLLNISIFYWAKHACMLKIMTICYQENFLNTSQESIPMLSAPQIIRWCWRHWMKSLFTK